MKTVYKVLAYLIATGVIVPAMAIVFTVAGLSKWIDGGGYLDKSVDLGVERPFPEVVGLDIHAVNGTLIIPAVTLLLLITSFFAKVPGGVKWAAAVLLLVVAQVALGISGPALPALGALHGLNALLLFSAAIYAGLRVGRTAARSGVPGLRRRARRGAWGAYESFRADGRGAQPRVVDRRSEPPCRRRCHIDGPKATLPFSLGPGGGPIHAQRTVSWPGHPRHRRPVGAGAAG